jgi:hypothetical protein
MRHPNTSFTHLLLLGFIVGCDPASEPDEERTARALSRDSSVDGFATPVGEDDEETIVESSGSPELLAGELVSEPARADEQRDGPGAELGSEAAAASHAHDSPADDLSAEPPEVAGGSPNCSGITSMLSGCSWERQNEGTNADVSVACTGNNHAVAGACTTGSSAHLLSSRPYENSDPANGIDDGDDFPDGDGWFCEWDAGPGADLHAVMVLCCFEHANVATCV